MNGKTVVVTGASSGLGEAIARRLVAKGARVILVARSEQKLAALCEQLGDRASYRLIDLASADVEAQFTALMASERIDAVIANAGFGSFRAVEEIDLAEADEMFRVNVLSVMAMAKVSFQQFARGAHFVAVASQAGKLATAKSGVYAASKHALIGFMNSARLEAKAKGIFVTSVNPGPIRTNFFKTADPAGSYEKSVQNVMLDPEKLAATIVASLFKPVREINAPWWMDAGSRLVALMPSVMEKLFYKQMSMK